MGQLFKPKANIVARVVLFSLITAPWIAIYVGSSISRSPYNTKVGIALDQPVPFSHKHHATELGIDCRFCHNNVENSAHAGLPSTETCMRCHVQTWKNSTLLEPIRESYRTETPVKWNKVNNLPEFVHFRHDIHIARGIACSKCHGNIQDQQITAKGVNFKMSWCLDCHRESELHLYEDTETVQKKLSPKEQVFNLYLKHQAGVQLSNRERTLLEGVNYKPSHEEIQKGIQIKNKLGVKTKQLEDCSVCHH
jgi:hypothetical protein